MLSVGIRISWLIDPRNAAYNLQQIPQRKNR